MAIDTSDDGRVRTIVLSRPEKLNAFDSPQLQELDGSLVAAAADDEVRVVVLTGAGRAFSAGADRSELEKLGVARTDSTDAAEGMSGSAVFASLLATLTSFPKPLLMAVNGVAVGFGATILCYADLVFMSTEARLRYPFTLLGVPPEAASSDLLARQVGRQQAAWLLLSSEWVSADEALRIGLAWQLCAPDELLATAQAHAQLLAGHSPAGVMAVKRAMNAPRIEPTAAAQAVEMSLYHELFGGPDTA